MKFRDGFVSNSSSASFVVSVDDLTDTQNAALKLHCEIALLSCLEEFKGRPLEELVIIANLYDCGDLRDENHYGTDCPEFEEKYGSFDPWSIRVDEKAGTISGFCVVDNFSMGTFMRNIGVTKAKFDEDDYR